MIVAGTLNLGFAKRCTFEAVSLQMLDANGDPVDLTGYNVAAEVRETPGSAVILDLAPVIADPTGGIVVLPLIDDETTDTYAAGAYQWDLLLEDGSDDRQRMLAGRFDIIDPITEST